MGILEAFSSWSPYPADPEWLKSYPWLDEHAPNLDSLPPPVESKGLVLALPTLLVRRAACPDTPSRVEFKNGVILPFDEAGEYLKKENPALGPCSVNAIQTSGGRVLLSESWTKWREIDGTMHDVFSQSAAKTSSSAMLGYVGEALVGDMLEAHYPEFRCLRTATTARSGDFHLVTPWGRIIVEVKNYTSPVPQKELAKMERDIRAAGAAGGVFISLRSGICGLKQRFRTELVSMERQVPVVHVASKTNEDIRLAIDAAVALTRTFAQAACSIPAGISSAEAALGEANDSLRRISAEVNRMVIDQVARIAAASRDVREVRRAFAPEETSAWKESWELLEVDIAGFTAIPLDNLQRLLSAVGKPMRLTTTATIATVRAGDWTFRVLKNKQEMGVGDRILPKHFYDTHKDHLRVGGGATFVAITDTTTGDLEKLIPPP